MDIQVDPENKLSCQVVATSLDQLNLNIKVVHAGHHCRTVFPVLNIEYNDDGGHGKGAKDASEPDESKDAWHRLGPNQVPQAMNGGIVQVSLDHDDHKVDTKLGSSFNEQNSQVSGLDIGKLSALQCLIHQ